MSDTSPKNQEALTAGHRASPAARQAKPRALCFQFVRADHVRFLCELVDDRPHGVDVQIFRNEEFSYSRRLPSRRLAEAWAEQERLAIGEYRTDEGF